MQRMPILSDSDMGLFELKTRYVRNYLTFAEKNSKDSLLYISGLGVYDSPEVDMGVLYHPEEGSLPEGLTWLCDGQEAAINGSGNPNQSLFPCKHSCVYNTSEAYPWMPQMEWQEWGRDRQEKGRDGIRESR